MTQPDESPDTPGAGARAVVAISAPTSLAVERARMHGVTLVALARNERAIVFNGGEHVRVEAGS